MHATADLLEAEVEQVARMMTREMGKPIAASRSEALKCVKAMRFYADHAEEFLADEPLADPSAVGASSAAARYEPLGVVLAVMPWNYPLWQVMRFAAPALMAGNVGLLKHASNVPESALYLDELFRARRLPRRGLLHAADRVARGRRRHRGPPRPGRHADRVGAGGPGRRRHRRRAGQEVGARARRLGPVRRAARAPTSRPRSRRR